MKNEGPNDDRRWAETKRRAEQRGKARRRKSGTTGVSTEKIYGHIGNGAIFSSAFPKVKYEQVLCAGKIESLKSLLGIDS